MDFSTASSHILSSLLGMTPPDSGPDAVAELSRSVRVGVGSFLGLQVAVVDHGQAVTITDFASGTAVGDIATSLGLPLSALGDADAASTLTLYAGTAGAFVDLAADLTHALRLPAPTTGPADPPAYLPPSGDDAAVRPPPSLRLDTRQPPITTSSGVSGLGERSAINRAVGVLIEQGCPPEEAHDELRHRAGKAHRAMASIAAEIVGATCRLSGPTDHRAGLETPG